MPSYYGGIGTIFSSLAIDRNVTINISKRFSDKYFVRYKENEEVNCLSSLKHDIFRTVLSRHKFQGPMEVARFADLTSGTGLGSSGSFTVALCAAGKSYFSIPFDQHTIAAEASKIEMKDLGRPVGLKDQYAASFNYFHEYSVPANGDFKER